MRAVTPARRVCVGAAIACLVVSAPGTQASPGTGDDADLSARLRQQTETFAEASQSGDAAVLARSLDADVVFTNETGEVASRQDVLDGAGPPPAGTPKRHSEIADWALRRQGADLATATFVDRVTTTIGGQTLTLTFRSTETWARRPDGWKIVASHTMNVPRPPQAVTLPASDLDDYVGVYRLADVYTIRIARSGAELAASVNGGPPVKLEVEVRDVLFTPGVPNARRIFRRDAGGHVVGYVNRRDGADLLFQKTS